MKGESCIAKSQRSWGIFAEKQKIGGFMKRILAFTLAALMLGLAFSGCGKSKKRSEESDPRDGESTTITTTKPVEYSGLISLDKEPENSKLSEIVGVYKKKIKLIDKTLDNAPQYFTFVDFNNDGLLECVTIDAFGKYSNGYQDYTVYYYDDGNLFSENTSATYLTKSGVFGYGNTVDYGEFKLTLFEKYVQEVYLWQIREKNTQYEEYFLDNKTKVTKEKLEAYVETLCKEKASWIKFTDENIEKYISVENMQNESWFCNCDKSDYLDIIELYKSFYEFSQKNENAFSLSVNELYEIFGISEDENERNCFHSIYAAVVNASRKGGAYYAGYAEKDLNGDGYPELILLTSNYKILDIYTKLNGKITVVDFAGTMGSIDANGNIYISAVGKGNNWLYSVSRLSVEGKLETYLEYGCHDRNINDMEWEYYIIKNGERSVARKDEIYALEEQYYSFFCNESAVNSELGFVPFFEKFDPSGMK